LQGRGDGRQKISKTLPSLSYRRRADHLAIDVEEGRREKDEASALPESEAAWIKLNEAFPSDPNAAHLPA
jgi:hypothetical protein